MNPPQERLAQVKQFHRSLERVVQLGYGDDECEQGVLVMFEGLVRETVQSTDPRKLPFKLPMTSRGHQNTYADLLAICTQLLYYAEHKTAEADGKPSRSPVLFPFMTALGLSGGVFMLAFHIARITHMVLSHSVSG